MICRILVVGTEENTGEKPNEVNASFPVWLPSHSESFIHAKSTVSPATLLSHRKETLSHAAAHRCEVSLWSGELGEGGSFPTDIFHPSVSLHHSSGQRSASPRFCFIFLVVPNFSRSQGHIVSCS